MGTTDQKTRSRRSRRRPTLERVLGRLEGKVDGVREDCQHIRKKVDKQDEKIQSLEKSRAKLLGGVIALSATSGGAVAFGPEVLQKLLGG